MMKKLSILTLTCVLVMGCSAKSNSGRYNIKDDKAPEATPTLDHIENAVPRYENYSISGNRDYEVYGVRYKVLQHPEQYSQSGIASWYGKKFHGHLTSNGEIYDMYSMSAAHKTLPLPSYVEVENTANGRKVIVRINDRGPFHDDRLIDLSYAAAAKLDVLKTGTAPVKITLIKPPKPSAGEEWHGAEHQRYFIQLAAVSTKTRALKVAKDFNHQLSMPIDVQPMGKDMFRVRLGPFYDHQLALQAQQKAKAHQLHEAFITAEAVKRNRL